MLEQGFFKHASYTYALSFSSDLMRLIYINFGICYLLVVMKTIILCGGRGTRLNEETEFKPKPLVQVGGYPILLHIMNIYAHYGHKEFILALGYKGDMIKDYFLTLSRHEDDFEFDMKTGKVTQLTKKRNYDYKIIFAETGLGTLTSERVLTSLKYVGQDEHFMVTYGDGVSSIDINNLIDFHMEQEDRHGVVGTISAVHPKSKYGRVRYDNAEMVTAFQEKEPVMDDYINGGFHVYSRGVVPYLKEGKMLEDTLIDLTNENKLSLYRHAGYWASMDTMKDYRELNEVWESSKPWAVWE